MTKNNVVTKVLSCLLVLTLLMSSFLTVSFTKEDNSLPTYTLSQVNHSQPVPVYWRFVNSSGYAYTSTLTNHYFRGEVTGDPSIDDIVAYCMDWGVLGPSTQGTLYDHKTTDVSKSKINQLTYVIMNGYPYAETYTLKNKYNVNRYGRSLTLTNDGKTGSMCMQTATQIAVWLVMGSDSRGRTMTTDGWVRNYNCENLDCDIMEMALDLYNGAKKYSKGIDWLSTDVSSTSFGYYHTSTNSKVYGPFNATSDFTESNSKITFSLSQAPSGTKILNSKMKEVNQIDLFEDFYVSVPNTAKEQTFKINLNRNAGMVLPLTYEAQHEDRQRMFFSTTTNTSTSITVTHTQSDAQLTIVKTAEDDKIEGVPFSVYYRKSQGDASVRLGTFLTNSEGKITLTGLSAGYYEIFEDLEYEDSLKYTVSVIDAEGNTISETDCATVHIPEDGMEKNHVIRFYNKVNDSTKIVIQKRDQYTLEPLSGAAFKVIKVTKNSNGQYVPCKDENGNVIQWEGKTYDDSFGRVIFNRTDTQEGSEYLPIDAHYTDGKLLSENNTYMIGETTAPNGYVKLETKYLFTLNEDNLNYVNYLSADDVSEYTPYYVNRPYLNSLKVIKYEEGTTKPIANVQYNIYEVYEGGIYSYIDTITTDENGVAVYGLDEDGNIDVTNGNALRYGFTYVIKEVSAPEGYEMNTEYIDIPGVTEDGKEIVITQYNSPSEGSFELLKVNEKDEVLPNTQFALYRVDDEYLSYVDDYINARPDLNKTLNPDGYISYSMEDGSKVDFNEIRQHFKLVEEFTTNKNGKIEKDLSYGEYIILETKPAQDYSLLNTVYRFGIYKSGETVKIKCVNKLASASVELHKTSSTTGKPVEGAIFALMKDNSKISQSDTKINEYTTDKYGKILVENLAFGDYYFIETFTPAPFQKPDDADTKEKTAFTLDVEGEKEIVKYTNDEDTPNLIIYKTDKDTKNPIANVKFHLLKEDGTKYREAVTNNEGKAVFTDVELGTYTLVEVSAPEGYDISSFEPITVVVDKYETQEINVDNDRIKGSIKVLKIDEDTQRPIKGVEFSLYAEDNEDDALCTLYTDENGVVEFKNIEYGSYIIKETKAVEGYKLSESKTYVVVKEAKEYFYTITNKIIERTVKLIKVDKDTTIPIANVEFEVYAVIDGKEVYYTKVVTDKNGECSFTLPFGEYVLKETKTGKGYKLTDEVTKIDLTLEEIEDILEITITNEIIKNEIILRKSGDEVGNYLKGAVYGLYDLSTDKLLAEGTTDEEGLIKFGNLPYGSYYFKEIKAPEGYELSDDEIEFSINEETPEVQTIDVIDTSVPQTGFSSNALWLTIFSSVSAVLFIAIVVINTKSRKKSEEN